MSTSDNSNAGKSRAGKSSAGPKTGPVMIEEAAKRAAPPPARGPVLIEMQSPAEEGPERAPPVPDAPDATDAPQDGAYEGRAMQMAATLAARKPSRLGRWFWALAGMLLTTLVSLAAWNYVTGLIASVPLLGYAVTLMLAAFVAVLAAMALRELAAFGRLGRIDALRRAADEALAAQDMSAASQVCDRVLALYARRPDTEWGRVRFAERRGDLFDAEAVLGLAEREVMAPLDAQALREVEAAARQVATVTALVPIALADVVAAMTANLRMIRRIAEVYGGRSGTLGSWRLLRAVMTHLVATGAVAVGDDMLEPIIGGGILAKLSRRFGEGMVNGALTARVGVAAIEVCRPLPFTVAKRPSAASIVRRALAGLFSKT